MSERWTPRVTVGVVVTRDDRFLMVEEQIDDQVVLNQPAGHLEAGESLVEAAAREVLEETRWKVRVTHLIGVHRWCDEDSGHSWLRFVFCAKATHESPGPLDPPVVAARWMSRKQLEEEESRFRSPLVFAALEAHDEGTLLPLAALRDLFGQAG